MDHIGVILACWFIMVLIYGVNLSVCLIVDVCYGGIWLVLLLN